MIRGRFARRVAVAVFASAGLAIAGCTSQQPAPSAGSKVALVGAGSTFDYPFFSRAFFEYSQIRPDVTINYQSIGSGGGIQQFTKKTVDFGATDVPMGPKEFAAISGGASAVIQIPIALGGVVIAYNLPSGPKHVDLSPDALAAIFLGKITNWSDPAIAQLNPKVTLPNQPILVVHRAEGSGTTYIFTDYLSAISPQWKNMIGKGKTVVWPAASSIGAKGNEGVAGQVRNTPGAIGYIELAYALQNDISYAALQNASGAFVLPSAASVKAAAATKPGVSATDFSIVNRSGKDAYPIAGYSWVLLYKTYPDPTRKRALTELFRWMLTRGQSYAATVQYVPLPSTVAAAASRQL